MGSYDALIKEYEVVRMYSFYLTNYHSEFTPLFATRSQHLRKIFG